MGSSDYSATARPYVVNLDVVGPLSVYVQVGMLLWSSFASIDYLMGFSGRS